MNEDQDDFENESNIRRFRQKYDYDADLEESIEFLSRHYSLVQSKGADLNPFFIFQSFRSPVVIESLKTSQADIEIEFYIIQYERTPRTRAGECLICLLSFGKSYPHTCVYKETLQEKINDWFLKQDVDFEDQKNFSKNFRVVSKDPQRLRMLLNNRPLDELTEFPNMEMELNNNLCLVRVSGNSLSAGEAEELVRLTEKLKKILS